MTAIRIFALCLAALMSAAPAAAQTAADAEARGYPNRAVRSVDAHDISIGRRIRYGHVSKTAAPCHQVGDGLAVQRGPHLQEQRPVERSCRPAHT